MQGWHLCLYNCNALFRMAGNLLPLGPYIIDLWAMNTSTQWAHPRIWEEKGRLCLVSALQWDMYGCNVPRAHVSRLICVLLHLWSLEPLGPNTEEIYILKEQRYSSSLSRQWCLHHLGRGKKAFWILSLLYWNRSKPYSWATAICYRLKFKRG